MMKLGPSPIILKKKDRVNSNKEEIMKDSNSLHLKIQEHIDCFATTDPLKELSGIVNESNEEDAALKWLALSVLHGITNNAKKIVLHSSKEGQALVTVEYREAELPSPGKFGKSIIHTMKEILHLEKGKHESKLALGVRDSNIELKIKTKDEKSGEKITIKFPKSS